MEYHIGLICLDFGGEASTHRPGTQESLITAWVGGSGGRISHWVRHRVGEIEEIEGQLQKLDPIPQWVFFSSWDQLGADLQQIKTFGRWCDQKGIRLECVSTPLDLNNPYHLVRLGKCLEHEREFVHAKVELFSDGSFSHVDGSGFGRGVSSQNESTIQLEGYTVVRRLVKPPVDWRSREEVVCREIEKNYGE